MVKEESVECNTLKKLLLRASQLQNKLKSALLTKEDRQREQEMINHYQNNSRQRRSNLGPIHSNQYQSNTNSQQQININSSSTFKFGEKQLAPSQATQLLRNTDIESLQKEMSTNMFDSRLNLMDPDDTDIMQQKLKMRTGPPEFMDEQERLCKAIEGLEKELIERTSAVLKDTDLLKEFQQFKNEQASQQPRTRQIQQPNINTNNS